MRRLETEQRLIHQYDYPKSDGLTKRDKAQDNKCRKQIPCLSIFNKQLITISTNVCKLFSYYSKPIYGLLASKRRPIDLQ